MMEPADHGRLDDPALIDALHCSGLRGVLVEGKVCSGTVVVDEVVAQQATQVGLVEDDDVIEALAAQGARSSAGDPAVGEIRSVEGAIRRS